MNSAGMVGQGYRLRVDRGRGPPRRPGAAKGTGHQVRPDFTKSGERPQDVPVARRLARPAHRGAPCPLESSSPTRPSSVPPARSPRRSRRSCVTAAIVPRTARARRQEPRRLGRRDPGQRRLRRVLAEGRPPVHRALPRGSDGPSAVAVQRRAPRSPPGQGRPAHHPARRRDHRGSRRACPSDVRRPAVARTRPSIPRSSRPTASATSGTGSRSSSMRTGSAGSSTA